MGQNYPAVQRQTAVTAYFSDEPLPLFLFVRQHYKPVIAPQALVKRHLFTDAREMLAADVLNATTGQCNGEIMLGDQHWSYIKPDHWISKVLGIVIKSTLNQWLTLAKR